MASIVGSGKDGRITKEDILNKLEPGPVPKSASSIVSAPAPASANVGVSEEGRLEERVPMSRLRSKVAERLLHASQSTAMLTTFNEVNMSPVMDIRNRYKEEFEKAHDGTRLGFMSFFVRACTEALKRYPAVNASLDGNDVIYHGYQDIGVAVSTEGGLVVPVMRDADFMSLADIEAAIRDMGLKARGRKAFHRRNVGWYLHYFKRWRIRIVVVHANLESSPDCYFGHAQDSRAPDGGLRKGGSAANDVPGAIL